MTSHSCDMSGPIQTDMWIVTLVVAVAVLSIMVATIYCTFTNDVACTQAFSPTNTKATVGNISAWVGVSPSATYTGGWGHIFQIAIILCVIILATWFVLTQVMVEYG